MNTRQAILAAADHIEAEPHLYEFARTIVPENTCGTPACALGWIAHFAGLPQQSMEEVSHLLFNMGQTEFYTRVSTVLGTDYWCGYTDDGHDGDPELTAKGLRLYADKYYSEEETTCQP